jgi:carbon storage regulator CsrA
MLVLSRRLNERIVLPALHTAIQVVAVKHGLVRLGIDAPPNVEIYREELLPRADTPLLPATNPQETQQLRSRLQAASAGVAALRRQWPQGLPGDLEPSLNQLEQDLQAAQQLYAVLEGKLLPRPPSRRRTALLVQDDPNECELLAGILRLAGMEVATAGDGADALDYLQKRSRPDVVLLEMRLPRCDGPTTVRAIRQNPDYADLKIFGVAGTPAEESALDQGPTGINRWFRKPIVPEVLLRELHRELDATAEG